MKKSIIAVIIVVIILAALYFLVMAPSRATALLYIEKGTVEVDTGKGWQPGADEMELPRGARIRTKDGEATVVMLEGEVTHLEPNSEIKLDEANDDSIKLSQLSGETWNKVTKLSGVSEYSVETPSTVATVRGTEFAITDEALDVTEGGVDYGEKQKEHIRVNEGKRALKQLMQEQDIPPEQLERLKKFPEKYIQALKRVRMREIRKHKILLMLAKSRGYSDEQIQQELNDIDEGRKNEDEIYGKLPSFIQSKLKRAYLLTKEIKRAKARAQQ